jgi:hypothetical protein
MSIAGLVLLVVRALTEAAGPAEVRGCHDRDWLAARR